MRSYFDFVLSNRRFVGFGFFVAFASSFGQTYFIGVFGPELRAEFALSHTDWGVIYMIGTLASACVLPWTGKLLDDTDLTEVQKIFDENEDPVFGAVVRNDFSNLYRHIQESAA